MINLLLGIDPKMKLFHFMGSLVVLIGALTGGMIGMLLPKISTGIVSGLLIGSLFAGVSCFYLSVCHQSSDRLLIFL